MLITQSGKFQNFEFELLADISSNTGRHKSKQIEFTVSCTVLARPNPVAMLLDDATVEPAPSAPTQAMEEGEEEETAPRDPPFLLPSNLHVADHPALASTDP
jgi:hypothetical protein